MTLTVKNLSKSFGLKKALDDISLNFENGKIHALLGENGAGKSTLASIVSGASGFDSGEIFCGDKKVLFACEGDGLKEKIVRVCQNPLLAESLTVMQNMMLGLESFGKENFRKKIIEKKIDGLIKKWAPFLEKKKLLSFCTADERFFVSFIGALLMEPEFLILDEPCSRLDFSQRKSFFENLTSYVSERKNCAVLLITHNMNEAKNWCDTVTVLEHGKISAVYKDSRNFDRNDYVFSKEIKKSLHEDKHTVSESGKKGKAECVMRVENLFVRPKDKPAVFECSFDVEKYKITLICGQQESGLSTLENVVTGMECEKMKGFLFLEDKAVNLAKKRISAREIRSFLRDGGTGIIPTDKNFRASNPNLTVEMFLSAGTRTVHTFEYASKLIEKAKISIKPGEKVGALSGGMLQKLMIARELSSSPDFLILCNPLQGLDSAGEAFFVSEMKRFVSKGKSILVLSSAEFPEDIADKIYRMEGGVLTEDVRK